MTKNTDPQIPERLASDQAHDPFPQLPGDQPKRRAGPRHRKSRDIDLAVVAERVRKVYIRERRIFEGRLRGRPSRYTPSPHWDEGSGRGRGGESIWIKIAKLIVSSGSDVEDYIKRVFDGQPLTEMLQPDQLLSWESRDRYFWSRDRKRRELAADLDRQKDVFDRWLSACRRNFLPRGQRGIRKSPFSMMEMIRGILLIDELEPTLTPWFRFWMAVRYGLQDVADHYREAAAWTYWRPREDYEGIYLDYIPGSFRRQAGRLYDDLLVRQGLDDASL